MFLFLSLLSNAQSVANQWAWAETGLQLGGAIQVNASTSDAAGNTYMTGTFKGTSIGFGLGTIIQNTLSGTSTSFGASTLFFVAKFDPQGNSVWVRSTSQLSKTYTASGLSITVDKLGNVDVFGYSSFDSVIIGNGFAHQTINTQNVINYFVAQLSPSGNTNWINIARKGYRYVTGGQYHSMVTDNQNNIYLKGRTDKDTLQFGGTIVPGTTSAGHQYIIKFNQAGGALWGKTFIQNTGSNSSFTNSVTPIVVGADNCLYATGSFRGTVNFGSYQLQSNGSGGDCFIIKLDQQGNVNWAKSGTGAGNSSTVGTHLVADAYNNIYLLASSNGSTLTFDNAVVNNPSNNGFIVKYDTSGAIGSINVIQNSLGIGIGAMAFSPNTNEILLGGTFTTNTTSHYSIAPDATKSDPYYLKESESVYVYVAKVRFGKNETGPYVECAK